MSARIVLLGASEFPRAPGLNEGGRAFRFAYERLKASLPLPIRGATGSHLLDLFDSPASAADIDDEIGQFLRTTSEVTTAPTGEAPAPVFVFYIGHGGLRVEGADYFLAVRQTRENNPYHTSLPTDQLAKTLRSCARDCRRFVFLDACFAASAVHNFQSSASDVVRTELLTTKWNDLDLRQGGTALLCAASKYKPARFVEGGTMFTGALVDVLARGAERLPEVYSMEDLCRAITERIAADHGREGVFPELHVPDQRGGRVDQMPLFVNRARGAPAAAPTAEPSFAVEAPAVAASPVGPQAASTSEEQNVLRDIAGEPAEGFSEQGTLRYLALAVAFPMLLLLIAALMWATSRPWERIPDSSKAADQPTIEIKKDDPAIAPADGRTQPMAR